MTDPTLSAEQDRAVQACHIWYKKKLSFGFYLAGPAGSGKTSIAKKLASLADNPQFCAYTGRAALQLTKKGCPAKTLHQLLYRPETSYDGEVSFVAREWDEDHPLWHCDLLLIDEASFVPNAMADRILRTGKPYLLIGDPYQLPPPTGGGALIANQKPDFLLTEIHRQGQDNPVLQLATKIREGRGLSANFVVRSPRAFAAENALKILETMKKKAPEGASHMLLAGLRETVRAINENSRKDRSKLLEVNEPVLCLRNNHDVGMMNGSIWMSETEIDEAELSFDEEKKVIYPAAVSLVSTDFENFRIKNAGLDVTPMMGIDPESGWRGRGIPCDYGYGRTVHKAQGDEAYSGVVIDESSMWRGEERQRWLYTAVTRFTHEVKIVSPR